MADRFPAEITIGGRIPHRLLDELAGMIASEGVSIDWQYTLDKAAVRAAIEAAAARGETVRFTDDEAVCGLFDDLESWLISHGIHFDRHSDARYEYDSENVYYRGGREAMTMLARQNGRPLVECGAVLDITQDSSRDSPAKLEAIHRLVSPPGMLPLEPIQLTGAAPCPKQKERTQPSRPARGS